MSTNFPTALDALTNPLSTDGLAGHASQHANENDAIEALQAKVGVDGSAVATSLDYKVTALETSRELTANKGVAGGYAGLDGSGKVPAAQLPSYVDDVVEYANLAAFPVTGETAKIYVALDTEKIYRWSGSAYVEISPSPGSTDSVTEGATNLYFTYQRVRDTVLTGLSLATSTAIAATDSVLVALGKLQAQITAHQNAKDASGGYAGLTLFKLNLRNAANTFTSFLTNAATAARTWTMPDKDGTVAMLDSNAFTGPNSFAGLVDISGAAAGQIKFPATANPSSDANTLDDYEEGSFTPTVSFGFNSVGVAYTSQVGRYTKIGDTVFCVGNVQISSKGSSVGVLRVDGLPFASGYLSAASVRANGFTGISGHLNAYVNGSSLVFGFLGTGTAADITDAQTQNSMSVFFGFFYKT
jgi:hypothetical protein